MPYRAFYCCYSTGEVVESADAYDIELDEARNLVTDMLRSENDFFGLIDDRGTTIQFMRTGDNAWLEIPAPDQGGSYGKTIPIQEVREVIKSLPDPIDATAFGDLKFEAW